MTASNRSPSPDIRDSLWLGLYFSRLALDVFEQSIASSNAESSGNAAAVAVIEQRRVHCANRDNLPPGLSLATAHALYPDLRTLEREPACEQEYLHRLAHWAYQFTPGVVIANRNSLLLEIGSCRRLHRGAHNVLKKIRRSLRLRGQQAEFGLARTPKAAWLLAQCGYEPALHDDRFDEDLLKHQLANIPVEVLAIAAEAQRALAQMGLTTLGDLHALPLAALGKRFGTVFIDYLQKVNGDLPDPQIFFIPPPRFQYGLTFIDGVAQRQMLSFPMKRLLQSLDDYLRARQLHCHTLRWQLFDAQRLQAEFSIELSRAHHRWKNLLELSRIKLDQVPLAAPVFNLNLICEDFFEAEASATQLFPNENAQHEAAAALIDKLQARLGNEALQRIELQESHWPDSACGNMTIDRKKPARSISRSTPSLAATVVGMDADTEPIGTYSRRVVASDGVDRHASDHSLRPFWLLPHPKPLAHRDNKPYWHSPLTLLRGPERIGNHWWQEEENERDYYIAHNARGIVCWIYRERSTRHWFLQGLFA